jgi:hypothetical protein
MDDTARTEIANAERELLTMENMLRARRGEPPLEGMSLFTIVVEFEGVSYSTQLQAFSPQAAAATFLECVYPVTAAKAFGTEAPQLGASDLIYVTAMEGLANVWALSAGRAGKYISAVCTLTEPSRAA